MKYPRIDPIYDKRRRLPLGFEKVGKELRQKNYSFARIARKFNVSTSTVFYALLPDAEKRRRRLMTAALTTKKLKTDPVFYAKHREYSKKYYREAYRKRQEIREYTHDVYLNQKTKV